MKRFLLILLILIFHFFLFNSASAQRFIGCRTDSGWAETPMLRTTFHVDAGDLTETAFRSCYYGLVVTSLGYHEVYVNGTMVGDYVMQPAVSQLDKRVLWVEYDITPYLHEGNNELLLWIGQGWGRIYGTPAAVQATVRKSVSDGECGLIYEILKTDSTWEASPSGYSYTGSWQPMHFGGERLDARVKPDWRPASVYDARAILISRQEFNGNHVIDSLQPDYLTWEDSTWLIKFDRVVTGWFQTEFKPLNPSQEVTIEYLDHYEAVPPFTETDVYIARGYGRELFTNRFHTHSFQYVRVKGADIVGCRAMQISAVDPKGGATFECSDPRLNAIHDMVKYTLSCLTFSGYMVDCPHIERMGYGGDGNSSTMTLQTLWDVRSTYANWMQAWHDAMDSTGDLPYVAPTFRTGGGPYWQGFVVKAPWRTYLNYGDRTLIYRHYNDMKRWLEYIEQHSEDYILQPWPDNERHSWFLGDWAVPEGVDKDGESVLHVNSCFLSECLADMIQMARMTRHPDDARHYAEWRQNLNASIHRHFYHPETHTYANGTPLDQCYALLMGIPPDSITRQAVKEQLLKDIHGKYKDHIAVGLMGVPIFTEWCIRERQADLMATILRQEDYPGYLHMINNGATTTWESWDCGRPGKEDRSRVHNCYNGIGIWFYQALAGIRPDPKYPGYKHFFIDPQPVEGIDWVRATKPTPYGTIRVEIENGKLKIEIPQGTTATLFPGTHKERTVKAGEWQFDLAQNDSKVRLVNPTVEMQDGSQPLATAEPRFSWHYQSELSNVTQIGYRIIVASSEENACKGIGDLWDSQRESSQMLYIPYGGKPLKSRDRCWWRVYTIVNWGDKGEGMTLASDVQQFEISLLSRNDWHARWIGRDFDDDNVHGHTTVSARYLRKEFALKKEITQARLYISGLGVYSAYLNGREVASDELLKPALSDYTRRIYFNAYDVTDLLRSGANAVGVTLQGGRFTTVRHDPGYLEWCGINHAAHYGLPQLLMQLEVTYKDGTTDTIISGDAERDRSGASGTPWRITNLGPIRKSNEFDGETYDARLDLGNWTLPNYDDSQWEDAIVDYDRQNMYGEDIFNPRYRVSREYPVVTNSSLPDDYQHPDPMQLLTPQPNPNIKVQHRLKPVVLFKKGDKWILDMGQNMVGTLECGNALMRKCVSGDTLTFRYAELLNADSTLYTANLRSAECTDRYIVSANFQFSTFNFQFTYHGFRYVEISGLHKEPTLDDFTGLVMYDEMAMTGSFETSNDIINAVYRNATWGIRGNYRSMPTDCPQRDERMGWTGDRTTGCYGESYIFGNHQLYAKWLQDLEDCQFENGALSDVAPAYWRNYTDNMTWPGAFITVADMLYQRFGDLRPIQKHYDAMRRWMLHMKKYYLKDGILIRDTYGDWCVPPESPELIHTKDTNRMTWPANLSTPYYVEFCNIMAYFAQILGRDDDARFFFDEADAVTDAYNARYLDTVRGCYDHNTVTANILPLAFGMVPAWQCQKVFDNIVDKTENEFGGHVSTGVVGIQYLMRTLTEHRRGDLALRLATNDTYPSWGYMVKKGATTIWELWNGDTGDPSMNSGNHVMLLGDLIIWYYEYLGGIRPLTPGYSVIELRPYPIEGLDHVDCSYNSVSGCIESHWKRDGNTFEWDIVIPPNTTAMVYLPTKDGVEQKKLPSGHYHLTSQL